MALTALVVGLGGAALATLPLVNPAFAGNGNGGGKGGGNGGGHGHDGGHGGGKGGGNGNGNGGGQDSSDRGGSDGPGKSASAGKGGAVESSRDDSANDDVSTTDDPSTSPHGLGKLNGFFHASPNALAHASPKSAIGRISHTFKDALSDFAEANEAPSDPSDPNATPPSGPSLDDLGGILAGATNKPVTGAQVKAIIDRLAAQNLDDDQLNDFADSVDDTTCQDIADAANAAKAGETPDETDDAGTDASSNDGTIVRMMAPPW